jgi:hypothetical protein
MAPTGVKWQLADDDTVASIHDCDMSDDPSQRDYTSAKGLWVLANVDEAEIPGHLLSER